MKTKVEKVYWFVLCAWTGLGAWWTWFAIDMVREANGKTVHYVVTVAVGVLIVLQADFIASRIQSWIEKIAGEKTQLTD